MLSTLTQLVAQYGYFAVGVGCLFEGETAILLGVFAAQQALLTIEGVVIAAIIGTIFADNACFHAGRQMGRPALDGRPDWQAKAARVEHLLQRYGTLVMIGFRFLYGLRYITPFVLGSLNISPWRFLLLDAIATVLWANTITIVGVYLAEAIQQALAHIQHAELALLAGVVVLALFISAVYFLRRRRRSPPD